MNLESKVFISIGVGLAAAILSFIETKISKRKSNNRENFKVGLITSISVLCVLFFIISPKNKQMIQTGNPNF